jgi:carbonic anhydrase
VLVEEQRPFAVILGCSDARSVPELVFDQGIGELFVVRVAGNIMTLENNASIEYAVKFLGVWLVVVPGHQGVLLWML